MKIQKLTLEGFRGFKDKTEFELHPNVNVFVGVNGSGKTSVLDATSLLLEGIYDIYHNENPEGFSENDLSVDAEWGHITIDVLPEKESEISLSLSTNKSEIKDNKNVSHKIRGNEKSFEKIYETINTVSFYKTNRYSETNVYSEDIDVGFHTPDFSSFTSWYVEQENHENRVRIRKQSSYQNPMLTPVRDALNLFFDAIESDDYSNLYVEMIKSEDSYTNGYDTILFIEKNKIPFKLNDLSDGEKMLILMISDIAVKLTIVYDEIPPEEVLKQYGIVLIDEIETHLHPAWQRDIIPALTHVFPNVQFLVTTHSPQVLSNVRRECVHMIKDFKRVPFTPSIYGADSNLILWDVFGVKKRPKHADEKFREYYKALETKDRETALKLLEGLQKHFGEDRLDVQKAKTAFEFEYEEYLPEA